MTESVSLKMKPGAAVLMALALITTTFAGVSIADPSTENSQMNTGVSMDYDELEMHIGFDSNGTDHGNMTVEIDIYDDGSFSTTYGPIDLIAESGNTSWNTHFAEQNLELFFEGNDTLGPMAEEGTWYYVDATVNDENGDSIGFDHMMICMLNGSVCESDPHDDMDSEQDLFDSADTNGDGAINGSEFINWLNAMHSANNESTLSETQENEILDAMADYDNGYMDSDGTYTEDADDGVLGFNEFLDFYYNHILSYTDASASLNDGMLEVIVYDELGEFGFGVISVMDMMLNELFNVTFNTTFWNYNMTANNYTDAQYLVMVSLYDTDGMGIFQMMDSVGDYDEDQIMFYYYDDDSNCLIEWEEFLNTLQQANEDMGVEPLENASINLFSNIFMSEDADGDGALDFDEFMSFMEALNSDEGNNDGGDDFEMLMMMLDTDGDGNISLSEMTIMSDETMPVTFFTNVFNHNDFNGDGMLDLFELAMFMAHMDEMDSEVCQYVKTGDLLNEDGWLMDDDDYEIEVTAGDTAVFDGEYCYNEDGPMSGDFMMFMADTDSDGKISLTEVIALFNGMSAEGPLSDVEEEWMSIAFMMSDGDGDELLDEDEFMDFYYQIDPDAHGEEDRMECHDLENMTPMEMYDNMMDCENAGYKWIQVHEDGHDDNDGHDDHDGHDGQGDEGEESQEDMLRFYDVDVWFEQWDDQSMELVIVELAVLDNQEEIDRLVMIADAEYGNNDSVLDQAEVDMLMGLYALSLNPGDMAEGLTLDGQNGTAVDFWVEVDGLLEGDDVVFLRLATVIQFPTTAYDTSTTHTFIVHDDGHEDEMMNSDNQSMDDSMHCDDELGIWIHNSETWSIGSAVDSEGVMEFTYDEINNMWYAKDDGCSHIGTITFILDKTENGSLPDAQDEDWTWEEEEMNMFPICAWTFSANFADNTSVTDEWMDEAPESGDYEMILVDDAAYEIFVSCWDPEGGKMVVDITSALGNSSNTSIGEAMGHIAFKLPAGTSGNVTFDVTWTDGHHTESGTLTVYATGEGDLDLSEIDVEEASGVLPGFTAGLGVLAMLGAAMLAGRRNNA